MGNCLVLQEKVVRVMKTEGKILEYKAPLKVHQLMSEYTGHAISQTLPVIQHLLPDADMLAGRLYYLLPLPVPSLEFDEEFSSTKGVAAVKDSSGFVRIKLVIKKQELEEMLSKGVSVEEMISTLQNKHCLSSDQTFDSDSNRNSEGWKPVLPCIPEMC